MGRIVGLVLATWVACAATAFGQAAMADWERQLYEAAKKEPPVTVYTAHFPTEAATRICTIFEARYPGVGCKVARMTAQVAFQKFQTEYAANLPIVSVFSSTVGDHCIDMKKRGQLQAYKPNRISALYPAVAHHNDPDNMYWVTAAGMVILSYNSTLVSAKDAPKKWQDLLDPKWKDKVSIGHPAFSGVVGMWAVAMTKMYGWQYFEKLEKNKPQIGRSIQDTVTTLNAKERWVAAGPLGGTLLSRTKGNPLEVVYPEDGAMLNIYPSCIPKNAPSPNAAKLYVEFQYTKESAEVQTTDGAPILIKGVAPAPGTKAIDQVKVIILTDEEVAKGIPDIKEKFRDTFGI